MVGRRGEVSKFQSSTFPLESLNLCSILETEELSFSETNSQALIPEILNKLVQGRNGFLGFQNHCAKLSTQYGSGAMLGASTQASPRPLR